MKKLLPLLLICLTASVFAQDTTWTKSDAKIWGTKAEKVHENMIGRNSGNPYLYRFVGFKQFYDQGISDYLQGVAEYAFDSAINKPGVNTYVLTKSGLYIGTKPVKVYVTFYHGKDERITSGKITGAFMTLAPLFLTYWPQDAVWRSTDQLKPGVVAVKHCYGDLISFKWIDGKPVILITKDPNLIVPVPPITASN